ncbi:glycine-rich domain-containing protein [Oricola sp.]|uniref:glycine-rich domain-containing protein n=1 Tax=Oricola sp. TaxID=1979950 RepID=UPI0025F31454|nr:hypothetical protein [Oricola sp.]MCI5075542.1 hypothetical protein [Oricola sp.]
MTTLDRLIPNSLTPDPVEGDDFMDEVQAELTGLWDRAHILLTDIDGTANAITGTLTPALTGSLVAGMQLSFIAAAENDGATTLNGTAVVDKDGDPLTGGEIVAGRLHTVQFDGTSLRLTGGADANGSGPDYQVFTADGTWSKPSGRPDTALVIMEGWAGGGGGGSDNDGGGGGGGGYNTRFITLGDLPLTLSVSVGAGGAQDSVGGNSSIDDDGTNYLIAYGGGGGGGAGESVNAGGGGAGEFEQGGNGNFNTVGTGGAFGGGAGGDPGTNNGIDASTPWAGGGGGAGGYNSTRDGGRAIYGGGGGAGVNDGVGGTPGISIHGGDGGASGAAGSPRGGGGGANASGGRGEIRVYVIG